MNKIDKRGTPATGRSPQERADENRKSNAVRYHLAHHSGSTELSETVRAERPEARFRRQGMKNPPPVKRGSAFAGRKY